MFYWVKNGMSGAITSEQVMDDAARDGAVIVNDIDGETTVVFDGKNWIGERPKVEHEQQQVVIVTPAYVDERMKLLLEIMEQSFEPALALIPSKLKKGIEEAFEKFRGVVNHADDER